MLNISIVLYRPKWEQEVLPLVEELLRVKCLRKLYLLDNSEKDWLKEHVDMQKAPNPSKKLRYMAMPENLGYGKAHNIALRESAYYKTELHLVMNSDIQVKAEDIDAMHDWMMAHPEVGQLMPRVVNPDGTQQYLAKRLPTPMDLIRRVLCGRRGLASQANRRFELRDIDHSRPVNAPYLSGCFMLLRTEALLKAGLFDERFFMYPEDIDLTRRIHRDYLTLYYPSETITHAHRRASYHSLRMFGIHAANMIRYFNKWGWFHDPERQEMNKMLY